jgi:hypothetical protein
VEKDFPGKWSPKQAGEAILVLDKLDFKPKLMKRQRRQLHINKRNNT